MSHPLAQLADVEPLVVRPLVFGQLGKLLRPVKGDLTGDQSLLHFMGFLKASSCPTERSGRPMRDVGSCRQPVHHRPVAIGERGLIGLLLPDRGDLLGAGTGDNPFTIRDDLIQLIRCSLPNSHIHQGTNRV